MRLLPVLALLALLAAPAAAAAQSPGKPVTRDALSRLIREGSVWCAGWRASDQSCDEVLFLEAAGDKVTQVRRYRISDAVDVEVVLRQSLKVDGPRLCWTYRFAEMDVAVLNEGSRANTVQSEITIALIRERMTDLEGKLTCESYARDEATGDVSATTTLDGEAAPDFDNSFKLLPPDSRLKLRPLFETTDEPTTT